MMRKIYFSLLIFICLFVFCSCYSDGTIIESLPAYESKEFYSDNTVQTFTNFGKYNFTEIEDADFEGSQYFTNVTAEDVEKIKKYVSNFTEVVSLIAKEDSEADMVKNFEFDAELISEGDYFHVKTREGKAHAEGTYGEFDNYSVYFMDMESKTLYYFHCDV